MSFLYPAFLVGALAVAIPIVLHLLRRDVAPEVPFTAVRLLQQVAGRARRTPAAPGPAAAGGARRGAAPAGRGLRPSVSCRRRAPAPCVIVAIDRSFSMGAPGVFAAALDRAREAVDGGAARGACRGHRVRRPRRCARAAGSGGRCSRRARQACCGLRRDAIRPVFQQAAELAGGGAGQLIIVTDLQRAGWDGEPTSRLPQAGRSMSSTCWRDGRENVRRISR